MHSKRWRTAAVLLCWVSDILVLSNMTLKTSHFNCSFEERNCRIFNVTIARPDDRLDTSVLGNRTNEILVAHVTNATMLHFPSNLFVEFTKIQTIRVNNCGLQKLIISRLTTTLTGLTLPKNKLEQITNGALKFAPNLRVLELNDNEISTIEEHAFEGLENLSFVDLTNNMITELSPQLFANQQNLSSVLLSGNLLKNLDETLFGRNRRLNILALDFNAIRSLPERLFQNNPLLFELRLTRNELTELPIKLFANLTNLAIVELSYNDIKTAKLEQSLDLVYLGLAHTHTQEFTSSNMTKLETLLLSDNDFLDFSRVNLSGLVNLRTLNMQSSGVTSQDLRNGLLSGLTNLESLDLSGNTLATIDLKVFRHGEKLKTLLLNNTQLTEVQNVELLKSKFKNLQYFDISDNRFNNTFLVNLRTMSSHIMTVYFDSVKVTKPTKFETTTPNLLEVLTKFQEENRKFSTQTKKWMAIQSCLLAIICFYAFLKILVLILRLFRSGFVETRNGRHYLLSDEITL